MTNATINTVTISKADISDGGMKSYKQDDDSISLTFSAQNSPTS